MAIKVKHDMNAAPAAAAGVASGRARRSMETARLFASGGGGGGRGGTQGATAHPVAPMGAHAQLTHASAPAVSAHAPAYRDTIDDRLKLQEEQNRAAMDRQQMGIDADVAKLESQQDFSDQQRKAEQLHSDQSIERKMRLQGELAEQTAQRERELYDYKLTQKQRMEVAAINDALEDARKSGRYTPADMAELERQADMQRLGIKPQAVPRGISPQRTVDENMVNIDGRRYFYTPNGDLKELDPRPSFKDFVSAFQSMRTVNTTRPGPGGVGTESVKETLSPEDTAAVVKSAADMYQKMFGVNPSAGQTAQPSPAPVPAPQPAPQAPAAQPATQESDEDFLKRLLSK